MCEFRIYVWFFCILINNLKILRGLIEYLFIGFYMIVLYLFMGYENIWSDLIIKLWIEDFED